MCDMSNFDTLISKPIFVIKAGNCVYHFKPEFTIVVFIQYKPQIAVAILDLYWAKMNYSGWQMKKIKLLLFKILVRKPLGVGN